MATCFLITGSAFAAAEAPSKTAPAAWQEPYAKLPLHFEPNLGQTDPQVQFVSRGSGYSLFLTPTESVLVLRDGACGDVLRQQLVGSNPAPTAVALDELPGKSNYFIGKDPSAWRTGVRHYARVQLNDVYPGIDLAYHSGLDRALEYDFIVAPGADPSQIRLQLDGAQSVRLDPAGNLVLSTSAGDVVQEAPVLYQEIGGKRTEVCGQFALLGESEFGFAVDSYDPTQPLVIDPILRFSTYYGGTSYDAVYGVALDPSGNVYITGETCSADFPVAAAGQPNLMGGDDAFVAKLTPSGQGPLFSTYLGGSNDDQGNAIAVDALGNAYIAGETYSGDFPTAAPLQASNAGDSDGFVTKLLANGSNLVFSTYIGGTSYDEADAIALNAANQVNVAGYTQSTNFPNIAAVQLQHGGGFGDGFISRYNAAGSNYLFSTFLGGSGDDWINAISVNGTGIFVTGGTDSINFPLVNSIQGPNLFEDAFVTKLNAAGSMIAYSTYLGGNGDDEGNGIVADAAGNAFIAGTTDSTNFPTVNGFQTSFAGCTDAFLTKLAPGNILWSTYLGGEGYDTGNAVAVSTAGRAFLTGETSSEDFPTEAAIFDELGWWSTDAYVTKFNTAGTQLMYSTYLGGCEYEVGWAIALDAKENAVVGGRTDSYDFPTNNAIQPNSPFALVDRATLGGDPNGFVTKISILPAIQDFNGNAKSDVLWRHAGGNVYAWLMNGGTIVLQATIGIVAPAWTIVGNPDLNGDAKADILWRHTSGAVYAWIMDGFSVIAQGSLRTVSTEWNLVGNGDFDGDGKHDIVWRHSTTGEVYIWFMNSLAIADERSMSIVPDLKWLIVAVGDYNADGVDDLFWRHSTAGANYMWLLNTVHGAFTGLPVAGVPDAGWKVARGGDFNGDGRGDILWRHVSAGSLYIWFMNGNANDEQQIKADVPDQGWQVFGAGDHDGDGKSDILWRHTGTGLVHLWLMKGSDIDEANDVAPVPDLGWQIQKSKP